ncbi:MAG: helix-turn-helix domain-containing protein [Christensenellaceae bacterium]|jgi:excisionase family DNA binding protein|nr:helix-turn-helix domain-containing protein [Christensenellaceae bacterium]
MSEEHKLLTLNEVCQYLRLSRDKVFALIAKESFSAHKIGRQWRFYLDEVDAWVKTHD